MTGKIARVTDRGFGFITPDEGGDDLFFHAKDVIETPFNDLKDGQAVTYQMGDGPKGPVAIEVEISAGDAAPATEEAA